MAKKQVLVVRVASDEVESQGPGTWVEFRAKLKMRQYVALRKTGNILISEEPEEIEAAFRQVCETLSEIVVSWNWTDEEGELLPKPKGNPDAFVDLEFEELLWLVDKMGKKAGERQRPSKKS